MISPDFFTSRTLNDLSPLEMMTFAGCWCHADDRGRFEDDEMMVRAAIWVRRKPITDAKVRGHLNALIDAGVLCRYSVNGYAFLHVKSWDEWQKINHPTPSKFPPCPDHEPEAWAIFLDGTDSALEKFREGYGRTTG